MRRLPASPGWCWSPRRASAPAPAAAYAHAAGFEQAVAASGLEYTILRSGGLDSNAFAWVEPIRAQRMAPAPFAEVGLPFVDPDDVAAVAAAVLTEDGHAGATYVLTGPAPSTPRQRAAAIADGDRGTGDLRRDDAGARRRRR